MRARRADPVIWATFTVVATSWALYCLGHWVQDLALPLPLFQALSWDEYQFLSVIDAYQTALLADGLLSFATLNEPFGYGSGFWQLYALWALPWAGFGAGDDAWVLFWLRLPGLALQLGALALVLRTLEVLCSRGARVAGLAAMCFLAPMCGLQLFYKPFSIDYLVVFATLVTVHLLARQMVGGLDARAWTVAAVVFGFAVGSKPYAILTAPLIVYAAARLLRAPCPDLARHGARAFFGGGAGFLLANLYLFRQGVRSGYLEKLQRIAAELADPEYGHAIQPPTLTARVTAWVDDRGDLYDITTSGLGEEFVHPGLLLALALALALVLVRRRSFGVAVGAAGALALAATVLLTNRVWTWYLLSPVFLLAIGVGALAAEAHRAWGAVGRARLALASLVLAALHVGTQAPGLVAKSRELTAQRHGPMARAQHEFFARWVVPHRSLLSRIEARGLVVVKTGVTPISSLLTQRIAWAEVLPHVDHDVGAIVGESPLTAAERAQLSAFTSICPDDEGVLLVRTDLLEEASW